MQYETSTQKSTTPAPAITTEAPASAASNSEAQASAGLTGEATTSASTDDLVATVSAMGSLGTVVLDALPYEQAMEVAGQLTALDWVVEWIDAAAAAYGDLGEDEAQTGEEEEPGVLESIADWVGLETGDTEDGWALAKQTADNLKCVTKRLDEASKVASYEGLDDLVAELETAKANFYETDLIAGAVLKVVQANTAVDAVERLCHASIAVYEGELSDSDAAEVYDEFFAASGAMGEIVADYSGPVGTMLTPMATLAKMFGEYRIFEAVQRNMEMHGAGGPNGDAIRDAEAEGYL